MIPTLDQLAAGKSAAQLNTMADQLETMADLKAIAAKKAVAVKGGAAKAATVAKAGTGGTVAQVAGTSMKAGAGTIWTGKGLSLGLGIGLGPWGPALLVAGGALAGWLLYKKYCPKAAAEEAAA